MQHVLQGIGLYFLAGSFLLAQDSKTLTVPEVTEVYGVQPGDELSVTVFRNPDLSFPRLIVPPSGEISFPLIGRVTVKDKTIDQLERELTSAYSDGYLHDPQVFITPLILNSMTIFVLGEVNRPGAYPVLQARNLVGAISLAGGFTQDAKKSHIYVIKKKVSEDLQYSRYDFDAYLKDNGNVANPPVKADDLILVPPSKLAKAASFFKTLEAFIRPVTDVALIERIFSSGLR